MASSGDGNGRKSPSRRTSGGGSPRRGTPRLTKEEDTPYPPYRPRHLLNAKRNKGRKRKKGAPRRASGRRSMLRTILAWGIRAGIASILALLLVVAYISKDLPDISTINQIVKTPSITVKAEDGTVLGAYGDVYGDYLKYDEFPKHLIDAVIATEDRNYFHHFGIDPLGIMRAMVVNVSKGRIVQGGSTITQQVAKNIFLTPERTLKRKMQEAVLSVWLERKYSKKEILSIYLNRVYLGAGNYGVDAASKRYFSKSAREMDLSESALIVGLLKAPSRYAPTSNPELAKKRAEQVLINMHDAGLLKAKEVDEVVGRFPETFSYRQGSASGSLYFTDWVVDQIPDLLENVQEDIIVSTTLNPAYQRMAEEVVEKNLSEKGAELNISQASLVAMDTQGAVKAMVGGLNYQKSQFNRATQAMRQPGSAFKLFVYLAALEAGYGPDDVMEDKPIRIGKWSPKNYTGDYKGVMSLRDAFAESINTIAIQLSQEVTPERVVYLANRLGIKNISPDASIALGSNEVPLVDLTGAFAHLAANGASLKPHAITKITDSEGNILYENKGTGAGQVLSESVVAKMNTLLSAVVEYGTGRGASIGRPVAGKTGTSQDFRDAWFIGFTPQLTTGVWVGNDNSSSMKKVTGGNMPATIWAGFMKQAMENMEVMYIPTGYASDRALPWQQQEQTPATAAPQNGKSDVELGPSFWDKLFGGDVKYEYPSDRR